MIVRKCYLVSVGLATFVLLATALTSGGRSEAALGKDPSDIFPPSSIVDFSFLLDPPAGKYGFLSTDSAGRFVWPNGRQARFWGVNISNRSVFIDEATIDRVVPVLARSGVNLVRFEALDSVGGLLHDSTGKPRTDPDPAKLAILDYWVHQLRQRGIYYYLNLLDLRTFTEADGVPQAATLPRAGRPMAMFDPQLIELQKAYAEALLLHRNPHSGLRYVDDPALVMLEICNESGFFIRPEALETLPSPYAETLTLLWNQWLIKRYGSRNRLLEAWSQSGRSELAEREDPSAGTVALPGLPGRRSRHTDSAGGTPAENPRLADAIRFLIDVQTEYFAEMRKYLKSLGVRVPITGVLSGTSAADGASSLPLDFTAGNYYCDHPQFVGAEWGSPIHFTNINPLREVSSFRIGPTLGMLRWGKKPVVVREWAQPWPNRFRCVAVPEVIAYGSLHDVDGLLLFGYQTAPRPEVLGDFDHQTDPPIWGLMGPAALAYLRKDLRPANLGVTLTHAVVPESTRMPASEQAIAVAWRYRIRNVWQEWPGAGTWKPAYPVSLSLRALLRELSQHVPVSAPAQGGALLADTRQVARHIDKGVLTVDAPRLAVVAGEIGGRPWRAGPLAVQTATPVGTVWASSLDERPLASSRHYLVKMVTTARNTGQRVVRTGSGAPAPYRLEASGSAPVLTDGMPRQDGVVVRLGAKEIVRLNMTGGTWEVHRDGDTVRFWCDTDSITGTVLGRSIRTRKNLILTFPVKASASTAWK